MKEFLAIEKAPDNGYILTPDKGTKNEDGSCIATNFEQLGRLINDYWREFDPAMPMFLSTISPACLVRREVKVPTNGDAIIAIYDGGEGIDGVRVQALGEDFVIGLHDAESGKDDFNYNEAMQWLKDHKTHTFNLKQATIIRIYIDDINDKLVEAGGEPFAGCWYTTNELYIPRAKRSSADYTATLSWFFSGSLGVLYYNNRYCTHCRCRPSLALPLPN